MANKSRKQHVQKVARRSEAKQERAAIRQLIGGGKPRQPHRDRWRTRMPAVPIEVDTNG